MKSILSRKTIRFICITVLVCTLFAIQLGVCFAAQKDVIVKRTTIKSVESVKDDYIQISWSKVSKADGYQIYRAENKNGTYKRKYDILM